MESGQIFSFFRTMIREAEQELLSFTLHSPFSKEQKADKTLVTACDKHIDARLSVMARNNGFQVVSEEGEQAQAVVRAGNYLTIDPIDGTLGYIEYVNHALAAGNINNFAHTDLGAAADFCLLLGIVEAGDPRFGACYNFVTKELILVDAQNPEALIRENNIRNYTGEFAVYVDQRPGGAIEADIKQTGEITIIKQAALGLKSLYTILNPHQAAITNHGVQVAGLWDVLPAAVAARAFGGMVYDDWGEPLRLTDYVILPGRGATIVKGEKFGWVVERLRKKD